MEGRLATAVFFVDGIPFYEITALLSDCGCEWRQPSDETLELFYGTIKYPRHRIVYIP